MPSQVSSRASATSIDATELDAPLSEQKYCVIAELGQGGMSVVHLATSRSLGNVQKLVVLKSIRPELLESDKVRTMFMDEARLSIRLTHPNIVQTYEVVMIDGCPVIVMEYMEGQSLAAFWRKAAEAGGFPLPLRLRVLIEALNGLDHAHSLADYDGSPIGLVHRDVSPQNIFITYDGHVKILDFGIAKALDKSAHTEIGEIKGKIRYMPPEQMQGSAELDKRADVFAMGVLLWEAIADRRLWQGRKDMDVMKCVLTDGIPSPRSVNPNVDATLEAICMKAVALEPGDRYESCSAMQAELERAADQLGLRASNKAVGALMQQIFAEARSGMRRAIDKQLKATGLPPVNLRRINTGSLFGETPMSTGGGARQGTPQSTGTPLASSAAGNDEKKAGLRWPYVAVPLALLGLVAAAAAFRTPAPVELARKPGTASPPVAWVATEPSSQSVAAPVKVSISASPSSAKLFLDGVELPQNPIIKALPRDSAQHEVRAEADGFESKTSTLTLSGLDEMDVNIVLSKKTGRTAPSRAIARPAPQAPSSARPTPAAANCANPLVVDESGIRRVRPECL